MAVYTTYNNNGTLSPVKNNQGEIPNRLEVRWQQPTVDHLGFETTTNGAPAFTPDYASSYRFQWATDENYENVVGQYDMRMIRGDGHHILCENEGSCKHSIGADVQVLTVQSNNGEPLTHGSYRLAYVGPTSPSLTIYPKYGDRNVKVASNTTLTDRQNGRVYAGDLVRINGDLYEVENGTFTSRSYFKLTVPFKDSSYDGTDVATAYYMNMPRASKKCINVSATADEMKSYLTQLIPPGTPYGTEIEVSRDNSSSLGSSYHITFSGAAFQKDVEKLEVLSTLGGSSGFYADRKSVV